MSEATQTSDPTDVCADQTGIASCNDVLPYTKAAEQINSVCMDPTARAQALVDAANTSLGNEGVPPNALNATGANGNAGTFDSQGKWQMNVDPTAFDDSKVVDPVLAADASNTVYHESRHTEQWYNMAQMRAGLGDTPEQLSSTMGIPADIAAQAAANPTLQCDPAENQAEQNYASVYGPGAAHRNQVLTQSPMNQSQYCALPEEADAWKTGAEVSNSYPNGTDARNLQNCQ